MALNRAEAERIAGEVIVAYRDRPRSELVRLIDQPRHFERVGSSGDRYGVEVLAVWDDRRYHNLRVMASVQYGWFAELTTDFILSPEGRFIGERGIEPVESLAFQRRVDEVLDRVHADYGDRLKFTKLRMEWRLTPGAAGWQIEPPTANASPLSVVGSIWNDATVCFGRSSGRIELWEMGKATPAAAAMNLEWILRAVMEGGLTEWRSKCRYRSGSCTWRLRGHDGKLRRGSENVILFPLWTVLPWRQMERFAPYSTRDPWPH